jgi:hypothetical protein
MTIDQRVYRWPNCNGYDTTIYKLAVHLYSSQATTFVQLQRKMLPKFGPTNENLERTHYKNNSARHKMMMMMMMI